MMNSTSLGIKILSAKEAGWETVYPMWQRLTVELPTYHFAPFGQPLLEEQSVNQKTTLQGCLSKEDAEVFIACGDGDTVYGTLSVVRNQQKGYEYPDSAVLFNLWVDPSMRRKKIGTVLVDHAKQWLAAQGVTSVQVGWHPDNSAAALFWCKHGFRQYESIAACVLSGSD